MCKVVFLGLNCPSFTCMASGNLLGTSKCIVLLSPFPELVATTICQLCSSLCSLFLVLDRFSYVWCSSFKIFTLPFFKPPLFGMDDFS
jgi:hypothetical protein